VARAGPRRFFAEVVEEIAAVALSPPKRLIGMSVWSLPKLRDYLVEQKIVPSISLEWLRHLLRQCRIRRRHTNGRRPTPPGSIASSASLRPSRSSPWTIPTIGLTRNSSKPSVTI
jgi:hypothetical protein